MEPADWWTSDSETDPYATGPDAGCTAMLTAVMTWDSDHPAIGPDGPAHGMVLLWEHPAEQWQHAERRADGSCEQFEFLPGLGLYAEPAAVVTVVRALLAGQPAPAEAAAEWAHADLTRASVDRWDAS